MSSLAGSESYRSEATAILDRAEEIARRLNRMEICEGHRLMVTQSIAALKHLSRIIEMSQLRAPPSAAPHGVSVSAPRRRHWRSMIWGNGGGRDQIFEAPT